MPATTAATTTTYQGILGVIGVPFRFIGAAIKVSSSDVGLDQQQ
jgi:hypothetical protein